MISWCAVSSASGIELNFDERQAAKQMSYLAGTEHYEVVLKAGDMERDLVAVAFGDWFAEFLS